MKVKTLIQALRNPRMFIEFIVLKSARWIKNDKLYLSLLWWCKMGYKIDWEHPETFCEKLQWLKLYNRNPLYTKLVDKYAVKEYVAGIIGEEHIIPTLGVWDNPKDIDFDALPEKFVLKTTHGGGGGGLVICKDKSLLDKQAVIDKLRKSMKKDIYLLLRESPYKNVTKRIIAEQYMEDYGVDTSSCLTGYKFFCFDGEPRYCQAIKDCNAAENIDFFDMEWNYLESIGLNPTVAHTVSKPERPANFEQLKQMARTLAAGKTFLRVDLYEINGKTYFGEITFYPASGVGKFSLDNYNEILGSIIYANGEKTEGVIIESEGFTYESITEKELHDIKIFCFNGKPKFFKIDFGRFVEHHANYYDTDLKLMPFGEANLAPIPEAEITIPSTIHKMFDLAKKLSTGYPFLRVDFYDVNGRIYFGELTFYPAGGMGKFTPEEYDAVLGREIELPQTSLHV